MRVALTLCMGLIVVLPAIGQTAERIEEVLAQDELRVGSAGYIAAASGGLVADDASAGEALAALAELGFPQDRVTEDDVVRLDQFAYMLMLAHGRAGGLLYAVLPGPRYAFRELRYERVIRGGGDPNDPLSGSRALRIVGRILDIVEAEG